MIRVAIALVVAVGCEPCDGQAPSQSPGGPCLFGVCGSGLTCVEAGAGSICAPPPRPDGTCGAVGPPADPCVTPCEVAEDCPAEGMACAAAIGACVWPLVCEARP